MQRFSPKSKWCKPHLRIPRAGLLYGEDEPSDRLPLKASGAYFQESQRALGNRDSTLKAGVPNPRALDQYQLVAS